MQPFLQHFLLRALKNLKAQEATGSLKNYLKLFILLLPFKSTTFSSDKFHDIFPLTEHKLTQRS
jgi:hypothetical protein